MVCFPAGMVLVEKVCCSLAMRVWPVMESSLQRYLVIDFVVSSLSPWPLKVIFSPALEGLGEMESMQALRGPLEQTDCVMGFMSKVAVADLLAFIVRVQVLVVPEQSPDQFLKIELESGVAVRVIEVPWL